MDLGFWQERLFAHFANLRSKRPSNQPIYALEHDLSSNDISDLEAAVRSGVTDGFSTRRHWLLLVVYSAEIGYRYTGNEYWTTFSDQTPAWAIYGQREWIRACFRKFSNEFGGMKPSGVWANHFSIICWPITHAILPKDLQRELARILYESRNTFTPKLLASAEALGQHIARRSGTTTSRFQVFAQEYRLLGQISKGLLFHGQDDSESQLLPSTLQRIVDDLQTEQRSRAWLDDAKKRAREVQLRGLARSRGRAVGLFPTEIAGEDDEPNLSLDAGVFLRPDGERWNVFLEFSNLSRLVDLEPRLTTARPRIEGVNSRFGRGWHLYEPARVQLDRWPALDKQLLTFEPTIPEVEACLRHLLLSPGMPGWLFKIGRDGTAREVQAQIVRPGNEYLYCVRNPASIPSTVFPRVDLSCDGLTAFKISVPQIVSESTVSELGGIGIMVGSSFTVWPAGLPARVWDGEGYSEWVLPDAPCLGIRNDTTEQVQILVRLGEIEEEVTTATDGIPVFLQLPELLPGEHRLSLTIESTKTGATLTQGDLTVVIRERVPWEVMLYDLPLFISMNPPAPTLEELWEHRASIEMHGPITLKAVPELTLQSKTDIVLFKKKLPPLSLSVEVETWRNYFFTNVLRDSAAQAAYDQSHLCQIIFSFGDFGSEMLNFQRQFVERRWVSRRVGQTSRVFLIDESDSQDDIPTVWKYEFEKPDAKLSIPYESAISGIDVGRPGGLYGVMQGDTIRAIILPPEIQRLQDLRITPQLQIGPKSEITVIELLKLYGLWATANVSGGLDSTLRQRDVLEAIELGIMQLLGGRRWYEAEQQFRSRNDNLTHLREEISANGFEKRIGDELCKNAAEISKMDTADRADLFACLLRKYFVAGAAAVTESHDQELWFAEFALRIASSPADLVSWAGTRFNPALTWLYRSPAIARAARFFVLLIAAVTGPQQIQAVPLYKAWEWR